MNMKKCSFLKSGIKHFAEIGKLFAFFMLLKKYNMSIFSSQKMALKKGVRKVIWNFKDLTSDRSKIVPLPIYIHII